MGVEALGKSYNAVNADFIPRTVKLLKKENQTRMVRAWLPDYLIFSTTSDMFSSKHQRIGITLYIPLSAYRAADRYI